MNKLGYDFLRILTIKYPKKVRETVSPPKTVSHENPKGIFNAKFSMYATQALSIKLWITVANRRRNVCLRQKYIRVNPTDAPIHGVKKSIHGINGVVKFAIDSPTKTPITPEAPKKIQTSLSASLTRN